MAAASWSIAFGILVYLIGIVFAGIFYYRNRKIFPVIFVASIATYIFAVLYTWDVFELNKNYVMAMLVISTILMAFLGKYFSRINLKTGSLNKSSK